MITLIEIIRYLRVKRSWISNLGKESWKDYNHLFKTDYVITGWIDFWVLIVITLVIKVI